MKRIPQLDGVRGVAILLVLVWHYVARQLVVAPNGLAAFGKRALSLSWSGVDLFFVLSGFLIAGILLDHRHTSNYFRIFYLRRACRIFPLYYLMFGLLLLISATRWYSSPSFSWLFRNPMPLWSYATFTQNVFMGLRGDFGPHWLGITWSLAVEEQFYLVVPILVYLLPRRALVVCLLTAIVAAPLLRWAAPGFHTFVYTPWRADSLLSGALLAVLVRWPPFIAATRRNRALLTALFGGLLAGAAALTFKPALLGPFDHLWLAGLYSMFVLIAFNSGETWLGGVLGSRPLVWFGQLSYGIYMFHEAVSGMLHGAIRHRPPGILTLSDAGITLSALVITLMLAAVSYRILETPFLRFGHQFRYLPRS